MNLLLVQNTFYDRLFFLLMGMAIGAVLGWSSRAMQYAREARDALKNMEQRVDDIMEKRNEDGLLRLRRFSLFLVVIFTASAAFVSGAAAMRSNAALDRLRENQKCTERAFGVVVESLNERTDLNSELNSADAQQNTAFGQLIRGLLVEPPLTEKKSRVLFENYAEKLQAYLVLLDKQRQAAENNPYPRFEEYANCLKDVREGK